MSEAWDWELTDSAERQFDALDDYAHERIASKLDEVVEDQWREPMDYIEPLSGVPHGKIRVGPFRLGCRADRDAMVVYVLSIKKRGGDAYRDDDD
jgi:mRNA interferase RelE/StbE